MEELQSVLCTVHSGQKMHAQELLFASAGWQQLQHMIKQELDWIDKTWGLIKYGLIGKKLR